VLRWASLRTQELTSPQLGLFASAAGGRDQAPPPLPDATPWTAEEALQRERETLGFFITGHPLDRYESDLQRFTNVTVGTLRTRGPQLPAAPSRPGRADGRPRVRLGGVIHTVRLRNSKKGDRYATFLLEDREGVVEVIAWPDTYRRHEEVVAGGTPVVVTGGLDLADDRCQVIAEEIARLDAARAEAIKQVHVKVPLAHVGREDLERLRSVLAEHPGPCSAFLHLMRADATETILALPDTIRVAASSAVLDAVERVLGAGMLSFR
jgi:DNA polymerase-3 subunit alpha